MNRKRLCVKKMKLHNSYFMRYDFHYQILSKSKYLYNVIFIVWVMPLIEMEICTRIDSIVDFVFLNGLILELYIFINNILKASLSWIIIFSLNEDFETFKIVRCKPLFQLITYGELTIFYCWAINAALAMYVEVFTSRSYSCFCCGNVYAW